MVGVLVAVEATVRAVAVSNSRRAKANMAHISVGAEGLVGVPVNSGENISAASCTTAATAAAGGLGWGFGVNAVLSAAVWLGIVAASRVWTVPGGFVVIALAASWWTEDWRCEAVLPVVTG